MIENIIGREKECESLQRCIEAKTSQLVIVYGRRRVGKTFLINQFFDNKFQRLSGFGMIGAVQKII